MTDKPLHIVLIDLLVASAAVAGLFIALEAFQIPNCTTAGNHAVFAWASTLSLGLAAAAFVELVVGFREGSPLSKAIAGLSLLAAILVWGICKWKLTAIATLAC